jgi:cell pole-organizing protein PopZ
MEEILASIRRIIAEDSDTVKAPIPEPESLPVEEEDVLELTEVVADEPPPPPPPPMPEPAPFRAPPRRIEPRIEVEEEPIVSADPAALSSAAFAGMTQKLRERKSEMYLGNGNITLEQMVRELLKPMLRDWLDENLPPLVERLVHEEIKRIAREAL